MRILAFITEGAVIIGSRRTWAAPPDPRGGALHEAGRPTPAVATPESGPAKLPGRDEIVLTPVARPIGLQ